MDKSQTECNDLEPYLTTEGVKPCPFCGCTAERISRVDVEWIRCRVCPASMQSNGSGSALMAMWNNRSDGKAI